MSELPEPGGPRRLWIAERTPRAAGAFVRALLSDDDVISALETLRAWPDYVATPLRRLPGAAARTRVASVSYKDEGTRFGAGSFKAAGAAWALSAALADARRAGIAHPVFACATDGNHGRAVAWAARRHGAEAVVYLPHHALPERERRIRALGARTVKLDCDYDEAVLRVRADAGRHGWIVVSDTSDAPADAGNLRVMAGYALIVDELLEQLGRAAWPTHVFLQAGVGTLAAGIIAELARRMDADVPRFVIVEPTGASCVLRSLAAGEPTPVAGPLDSAMDCLAAGHVSATAWPILHALAAAAIAIDDAKAEAAVAALSGGELGAVVHTAPSGAAGLAGLLELAANEDARASLGLSEAARVVVIGTEEALAAT